MGTGQLLRIRIPLKAAQRRIRENFLCASEQQLREVPKIKRL
jgi:hypothetical protein